MNHLIISILTYVSTQISSQVNPRVSHLWGLSDASGMISHFLQLDCVHAQNFCDSPQQPRHLCTHLRHLNICHTILFTSVIAIF